LEAAAHGRALIASRVGGIPEYADPSYALLVAPNDVDGLAAAISRLATDADDAEQLGAQGATLVRTKHTMSAFVDQMDAVYDSLPASVLPPAPSPAPQFSLVAARRM
jgi:glycosyltransferase involved in cell wall biosynthesis